MLFVSASDAVVVMCMQVIDARLRQVDNHIKHMPYVIAATIDAKLAELRAELLTSINKRPASNPPHSSGVNGELHECNTYGMLSHHAASAKHIGMKPARQPMFGTAFRTIFLHSV